MTSVENPLTTPKESQAVALPSWLEELRRNTFKTRVLPLPPVLLAYLHSDSIFIPGAHKAPVENDDAKSVDSWGEDDEAEDDELTSSPEFAAFLTEIKDAIHDLGGAVMPKLNWSAPTDARWIAATGNLKCTCVDDVLLLLKSSDRLSHDIALSEELEKTSTPSPLVLVLRKWYELNPSMEFRAFVREGKVVACCQRDSGYYAFLHDMQGTILERIEVFVEGVVDPAIPLEEYVVDLYYEQSSGKVWLVDVNAWAEMTLPLLFSWEELRGAEGQGLGMRLVRSEGEGNGHHGADHLNSYPQEAVQLTMQGGSGGDAAAWSSLLDLSKKPDLWQ